MEPPQIYILISIIVLLLIFVFLNFIAKNNKSKKQKPLTPLASLAFGFIIAGIVFGENRIVSYSLMGFGVLLAIIDILKKLKKK